MEKTRWLVLDCNFLCYRSFFTTGGLSHNNDPTGVIYGFFRDLKKLQDRFPGGKFVFTFDHGKSLRETQYPWYKESRRRKKLTDDELAALNGMRSQIFKLKMQYLNDIGYANVFYQDGYEADDIIASFCKSQCGNDITIVSADKDLYQLLDHRVSLHNPNKDTTFTRAWFEKTYRIRPSVWATVKAIAGCSTDSVSGVEGVGEKTAIAFVLNRLKPGKKLDAIEAGVHVVNRNFELVKLPFAGCKSFTPKADNLDQKAYERLLDKLGIRTLTKSKGRIAVRKRGFGVI